MTRSPATSIPPFGPRRTPTLGPVTWIAGTQPPHVASQPFGNIRSPVANISHAPSLVSVEFHHRVCDRKRWATGKQFEQHAAQGIHVTRLRRLAGYHYAFRRHSVVPFGGSSHVDDQRGFNSRGDARIHSHRRSVDVQSDVGRTQITVDQSSRFEFTQRIHQTRPDLLDHGGRESPTPHKQIPQRRTLDVLTSQDNLRTRSHHHLRSHDSTMSHPFPGGGQCVQSSGDALAHIARDNQPLENAANTPLTDSLGHARLRPLAPTQPVQ